MGGRRLLLGLRWGWGRCESSFSFSVPLDVSNAALAQARPSPFELAQQIADGCMDITGPASQPSSASNTSATSPSQRI
jgi:hypothetical protein